MQKHVLIYKYFNCQLSIVPFLFLYLLFPSYAYTQKISIFKEQKLEIGQFYITDNSGGTVVVPVNGSRMHTGSIILIISPYHPAVFTISTDSPKSLKVLLTAPDIKLTDNTKSSIKFIPQINTSSVIVSQNSPVQIFIGGRLIIDNEKYNGEFSGELVLHASLYEE